MLLVLVQVNLGLGHQAKLSLQQALNSRHLVWSAQAHPQADLAALSEDLAQQQNLPNQQAHNKLAHNQLALNQLAHNQYHQPRLQRGDLLLLTQTRQLEPDLLLQNKPSLQKDKERKQEATGHQVTILFRRPWTGNGMENSQ